MPYSACRIFGVVVSVHSIFHSSSMSERRFDRATSRMGSDDRFLGPSKTTFSSGRAALAIGRGCQLPHFCRRTRARSFLQKHVFAISALVVVCRSHIEVVSAIKFFLLVCLSICQYVCMHFNKFDVHTW